ncbi:MAG: FAD binding domain-containing protein [Christensenellales bacterium]|jgi:xanthine dehydrogenase FAD-binding subunit
MASYDGGKAMIPFDFIYCRPKTLEEAVTTYTQLEKEGKKAVYYAGGSEIITMCRAGTIRPGAVIDIKHIPDCKVLSADGEALHLGAACTLNKIKESRLYDLLRLSCGRIADHTNQCRITLGGNLCGTIIYRETSLPLLVSDATVTLYGPQGQRNLTFESIFDGRARLKKGEMIVKVDVPLWAMKARHFHVKRTQNEKIDYPLISVAAIWKEDFLRVAFSGVCQYPFRSEKIEAALNDRAVSCAERAEMAAGLLPKEPLSDAKGSGEYRLFVLKNTLEALLEDWENGKI